MRVDALALKLRPRPMYEAADLGVRLVQAHARSVWRCYAPVWAAVVVIALASSTVADWLPMLLLFLAKPWLDRTLLFVLSRAVFGEPTRLDDVMSSWRPVWWQGVWRSLTLARLSPWRAYSAPVWQLEGQRGAAARARLSLLLRGRRGVAAMVQAGWAHLEFALAVSLVSLVALMLPAEHRGDVFAQLANFGGDLLLVAGYAAVMLVVEPFFVASGFAMYLNRRVELEAWDVEQEFRRVFAR